MPTLQALNRLPWSLVFALLLALRLVDSAGYMPALGQGRLTLMLCPDGEWTAPATAMDGMAMGRHGPKSGDHHQPCPYAAAAAMPVAGGTAAALVPLPAFTFAFVPILVARPLVERALYRRPPSTGPPTPA